MFAVTAADLFRLTPDGSGVYRWDGGQNWTKVGERAEAIIASGNTLLKINPDTRDVWRYLDSPDQWERIGGPGSQFAVNTIGVFGLAPDGSSVFQWCGEGSAWGDGKACAWQKVRDTAGTIVAGSNTLLATDLSTGDIFRYLNGGTAWERIGGPGRTFVVNGGGVFGQSPNAEGVFRWTGTPGSWVRIGGAFDTIVGAK
jgi:hypothetical protein